jgi:hypothetical protein
MHWIEEVMVSNDILEKLSKQNINNNFNLFSQPKYSLMLNLVSITCDHFIRRQEARDLVSNRWMLKNQKINIGKTLKEQAQSILNSMKIS